VIHLPAGSEGSCVALCWLGQGGGHSFWVGAAQPGNAPMR